MDPLRKMDDDVFTEICCMENVDIEYVATENIEWLSSVNISVKPFRPLNQRIYSLFPVYISLFSFKEMRIILNKTDLIDPIMSIVEKYCEKNIS